VPIEGLADRRVDLRADTGGILIVVIPRNKHAPVIVKPRIELTQNLAIPIVPLDGPSVDDEDHDLALVPRVFNFANQVLAERELLTREVERVARDEVLDQPVDPRRVGRKERLPVGTTGIDIRVPAARGAEGIGIGRDVHESHVLRTRRSGRGPSASAARLNERRLDVAQAGNLREPLNDVLIGGVGNLVRQRVDQIVEGGLVLLQILEQPLETDGILGRVRVVERQLPFA
jgi:hypothetical protein